MAMNRFRQQLETSTSANDRLATGLLTRTEERKLIELYKLDPQSETGRAAQERLIQAHQPLVKSIASQLVTTNAGYVEFDDLVSEGNIGMLIALRKFDLGQNNRFSTYAQSWIFNRMSLWSRNERWTTKIPDNTYKQALLIMRCAGILTNRLGREPNLQEIANELGIPLSQVENIHLWVRQESVPLSQPVGQDGKSQLKDFIQENQGLSWRSDTKDNLEVGALRRSLKQAFELIAKGQAMAIDQSYGLGLLGKGRKIRIVSGQFSEFVVPTNPDSLRKTVQRGLDSLRRPITADLLKTWLRSKDKATAVRRWDKAG